MSLNKATSLHQHTRVYEYKAILTRNILQDSIIYYRLWTRRYVRQLSYSMEEFSMSLAS